MDQFLEVVTEEGFEGLSAIYDAGIESKTDSLHGPPPPCDDSFDHLQNVGRIRRDAIQNSRIQDYGSTLQDCKQSRCQQCCRGIAFYGREPYGSLAYIWVHARNLTKPVMLSNPPESEMVDKEGMVLLD
jgi:hypothetical protein